MTPKFQFDSSEQALFELAGVLQNSGYHFTTTTPATHHRVNSRLQNQWARTIQDALGWSRPFREEILPRDILDLMNSANIIIAYEGGWRSTLRLSSLENHLFWHSAYPTIESDAVFLGPDTYRFARAIQDFLASQQISVKRAADIGCGAGPGAILVASAYPQAQVLAIDINDTALRLTRVNAALAKTTNIEACNSNLLSGVTGQFDLLVANPPYLVDPDERTYRHGGGPLGAGLSIDIVKAALDRLASGGTLLLYTGAAIMEGNDPFRIAIEEMLHATNVSWKYFEVDPDVFGEELESEAYAECDRIAAVVLILTKP